MTGKCFTVNFNSSSCILIFQHRESDQGADREATIELIPLWKSLSVLPAQINVDQEVFDNSHDMFVGESLFRVNNTM